VEPDYYRKNGVALADTADDARIEIDLDSGDVIRAG
jgi:hypothetical protein